MNKVFILFLIVFNCSNTRGQQDSVSAKSDLKYMIGVNAITSTYTFGIEEGADKGKTNGFSISFKLFNQNMRKLITLETGSFHTVQKSPRLCEYAGNIGSYFRETVSYLTLDFNILKKKYFLIDAGFSANDSRGKNTVCYNEIYFDSPLLHYNLGAGLIDHYFINFGFNTDYEINNNHNGNHGFYITGVNYIFTKKDFVTLDYYWNRDNYNNSYSSGWLMKSHFSLYKNFGINGRCYYSMKIKGVSLGFGFTCIL